MISLHLLKKVTAIVMLFMAIKTFAYADTILTLDSTESTYIDATTANQNTNYGSATSITIVNQFASNATFGLLRWDLSSLPLDATITSATINLYKAFSSASGSGTFLLYAATSTWDENTVTYATRPNKDLATILASTPFTFTTGGEGTLYSLSGAGLLTAVQSWYSTPSANFGVYLQGSGVTAGQFIAIRSDDSVTAAYFPELVLTYTVPEPTARILSVFFLGFLGIIGLVRQTRRQPFTSAR